MSSVRERGRRRPRVTAVRAATLVFAALLLTGISTFGTIWGKFTSSASDTGNQVTGAADWVAPTASSSVIQKTQGGTPGYTHSGGTYRVYANTSDSGNPASGIASVTGNVGTITSGQTSAALSSGSFSVFGQSYNYETASLTAGSSLAAGTYNYTLTSTDNAGNSGTQSGYSVVVDNTAPTGTSATSANHTGGTVGRAEAGDTITFTYSEPIDPNSIVSGWTGSAPTNAVVRLNKSGGAGTDNSATVYDSTNTTQLPLGLIDLGQKTYTGSNITFGATGTPSTIAVSGNSLVVTLGSQSAAANTAPGTATIQWTTAPPTGATDRAGNALTPSTVSGTATRWF